MAWWRKKNGPELFDYRRAEPELVDYREVFEGRSRHDDLDDLDELSPVSRTATALLLNALAKGASTIRLEPPAISPVVQFRIDGRWHDEVRLPPGLTPGVGQRFRAMALLDPQDDGPAVGQLLIVLGADEDAPRQFLVLVRPAQQGARLLVRVLADSERARLRWPAQAGTDEAEAKLRAPRERLLALAARSAPEEEVEREARCFLAEAEALVPGAYREVIEARTLLADLAARAGATDRVMAELGEALALSRSYGAPAMSTSLVMERLADAREAMGDLDGAVDTRREAIALVRQTLAADDPYLAGILGRLASTLVAGGRVDEAERAWDEAIVVLSELAGDDDIELRDLVSARARAASKV